VEALDLVGFVLEGVFYCILLVRNSGRTSPKSDWTSQSLGMLRFLPHFQVMLGRARRLGLLEVFTDLVKKLVRLSLQVFLAGHGLTTSKIVHKRRRQRLVHLDGLAVLLL